jgi:hypothetical protein
LIWAPERSEQRVSDAWAALIEKEGEPAAAVAEGLTCVALRDGLVKVKEQ